MKNPRRFVMSVAVMLAALSLISAAVEVGQAAPDFTLVDISGNRHSLSDFKGKTVVLEWVNPECPFVIKHYDQSGNIPGLQKAAAADGIIWLSINSSAAGREGDYDATAVKAWQTRVHSGAEAYFRDKDGKVGKLYDARTTPHLFIIDGRGTLVYADGIDSIRSVRVEDIARATNYVSAALADLKAGRPVKKSTSQPYGCAVKY